MTARVQYLVEPKVEPLPYFCREINIPPVGHRNVFGDFGLESGTNSHSLTGPKAPSAYSPDRRDHYYGNNEGCRK